ILYPLTELRRNLGIDRELTRVDDSHIHAGFTGVVEEHRVHRLAYGIVAAEGKGDVADAAADQCVRQMRLDVPGRSDEIHRVVVVFLDSCRDRKDVRIEDDVFRRKTDLLRQNAVAALAYL